MIKERTCIACRRKNHKSELLRIVNQNGLALLDDKQTINAFYTLVKTEGIIPALESSHAVAYGIKLAKQNPRAKILINLSGRGDKDLDFILKKIENN